MNRLVVAVLVIFVAFLGVAATAAAQPSAKMRSDATTAYQEGQRRYLDGDYAGAAAQFEAAYKLDPDPAYLFNIAQAYRLAKDCSHALAYYKQFLVAVPNAPNAAAVAKYIDELDATCGKPERAPVRVEPAHANEHANEHPHEHPNEHPNESPLPPPTDHGRRNIAIGAIGLGVVGAAVGTVFTFKVRSYERQREALCHGCEWTRDDTTLEGEIDANGHRASKLAITGYIVGGVGLAAGAALLATLPRRGDTVTIAPTHGGAFVSWTIRN